MKSCSHLARYKERLDACSLCGLCDAACPVLARTGRAGDSPRGRMALLISLSEGSLDAAELAASLVSCALCGQCSRACPGNLPLERIFLAARLDLAETVRPQSWRERLLALSLRRPEWLDRVQPLLALAQRPGRLKAAGGKELEQKLNMPPLLALAPFGASPKKGRACAETGTVLFTGCLSRRVYTGLALACAEVLRLHGEEPVIPVGQTCCGRHFAAAGHGRQAAALVRRNLAVLGGLRFTRLVTPCPACLDSIKGIWPHLEELSGAEKEQARELAGKALDINAFLGGMARAAGKAAGITSAPVKAIWHEPCLMERQASGMAQRLAGLDKSLELLPPPGGRQCCGAPLARLRPGLAWLKPRQARPSGPSAQAGVAMGLRDAIMASGASCVATACPGCMLALERLFAHNSDSVRVRHSVEIYLDALKKA